MISEIYTYGYDTKAKNGKVYHHSPRLVFGNKPEEIERYKEAIEDKENLWIPHHVLEWKYTKEELIKMNRYDKVIPDELIWIRYDYHTSFEFIHKAVNEFRIKGGNSKVASLSVKGKKWFTDGTNNIRAFECPEAFKEGKTNFKQYTTNHKMTEEQRKFTSERFKKLKWFNNGIVNKRSEVCPEGFIAGRLEKDRESVRKAVKRYYKRIKEKENG